MASIRSEIETINKAKTDIKDALVAKLGIPETSFYTDEDTPKRLSDWPPLILGVVTKTAEALTFSNAGLGDSSGTTFDGSVARTISYNSIGAAAYAHNHGNITADGKITTSVAPYANSNTSSADYLIISDASNAGTLAKGIQLTNAANQFLSASGTWQIPTFFIGGMLNVTNINAIKEAQNNLKETNNVGLYLITDPSGKIPSKRGAVEIPLDCVKQLMLSSPSSSILTLLNVVNPTLSTVGVNVGDIIVITRVMVAVSDLTEALDITLQLPGNVELYQYKIIATNDAKAPNFNDNGTSITPGVMGLMSPWDKLQVNLIAGILNTLANKLNLNTNGININGASSAAYTNVTSGRTNWADTSTNGAALSLGNLQMSIDNSGRLYSRNGSGIWNMTNQMFTTTLSDVDAIYTPSVFGYGELTNNSGPNASGNYTVYTLTSSDYDSNGYRSILQIAINRNNSTPYIRTTFKGVNGSNTNFIKTDWVGIPRTLDDIPDGTYRELLTLGTTSTTASAGDHSHGNITNAGAITTNKTTPTTSDYILISDVNDSNKIKRGFLTVTTLSNSASASDSKLPTEKAVRTAIDNSFTANDAMRYKGILAGTATSPGTFTPLGVLGDTYKVSTAGYINGIYCEVGDMVICCTDSAAATSSTYSTIKNNWNYILANIDPFMFVTLHTDLEITGKKTFIDLIKIANTSNTERCILLYDATNKCLKFIFE